MGAASATFDAVVHLAGSGKGGAARAEFGQMDQGELPRLQAYVAERRLPVRRGWCGAGGWFGFRGVQVGDWGVAGVYG